MQIIFNNPFEEEGNWYKGNLHTHTTNSDGLISPEDIAKQYAKAGYHFLSITDHCRITRLEETHGLLLIPGEEIHCGKTGTGCSFHLVGIDMKEEISYKDNVISAFNRNWWEVKPQEIVDLVKKQGGEVILAHPHWSGFLSSDLFVLNGYFAVEVFNTIAFHEQDKGYAMTYWDNLLSKDQNIFAVATDDAHGFISEYNQGNTCGAWIMVKSKKLTSWDIMREIKKGMFYSSNGPEIKQVRIVNGIIKVETSPVRSISFISQAPIGKKFTASTEPIRSAEYEISGQERFIRIQCRDMQGRMAWTNAMFVKTLTG